MKHEFTLKEEDYYEHITYQAAFSIRQIGSEVSAYYSYTPDSDGLPSIYEPQEDIKINLSNFPAFPLKHLIDFLNNVNNE